MEIRIEPAHEPRRVLLALAAMLTTLAGPEVAGQIEQADRPDAGMDKMKPVTSSVLHMQIANRAERDPSADLAAAFGGAGNGAGLLGSVPSQPPALIGAGLPTTQTATSAPDVGNPVPDLAAAFGGNSALPNGAPGVPAPNAVPVPPANSLPGGMPPVPPNGAPTAGASTQVETDADGLPWNAEIHSSNKKMAATGKWMARRNVSDATLERVTAQLKAAMSVGNVQPPAGIPPPPPPLATPTAIPLPGTTPGAAAYDGAVTLPMLLPRITAAMAAGHLTADATAAIAMDLSGGKINNVAMLAVAPQLIPAFWARLDQLGIPS